MRKISGVLFFVLVVFLNSNSAQTIEKIDLQKDKTDFFAMQSPKKTGSGKNPLTENGAETKSFETRAFRDADSKKDSKAEQDTVEPVDYQFRRGEKEWNIDLGYSPFEPTNFDGSKAYNTAGRKLGLAVVRWGRVFGTVKGVTYQYIVETIPFIISLKNEVENPDYVSPTATPGVAPTKRETSYGVGLTPVAFRFYFRAKNRIKPFVQIGAGVLYMNKPMPLPKTSMFNFTGYFGGGLMIHKSRKRAISLSYRYFHISNANTQHMNPAYNANVFSLGYSFFYGK